MNDPVNIWTIVSIGVASAAAAVSLWIAWQTRRYRRLEPKRDVLRRLSANLYRLTPRWSGGAGEPFDALNEAWIVFADSPTVIDALKILHRYYGHDDQNVPALIRAMAKASGVPLQNIDNDYLERPFTPSGA